MLSPLENQGPIQIYHLKKTNFQENFERFLTHIKEDKKDDLRIAYHKNRELLKASIRLKIPEVEPNFMQTFKMYNQLYWYNLLLYFYLFLNKKFHKKN